MALPICSAASGIPVGTWLAIIGWGLLIVAMIWNFQIKKKKRLLDIKEGKIKKDGTKRSI